MGAGTQGCGGPLGCPPALSHPPQLTCRCLHKLQRLQKSAKPPDSPDSRAVVQTLQMLSRNFIFCSSPCGIYATNPQRSGGAPRAGSTPPTPHTAPQHPAFTSIQVLTNSSMVRTASSSSTYTSRSSKAAGREQGGRSGGVLATPPGGGGEPGAFVKGRGSCTHGHAAPPPLPPPHPRA